MTEVAFNTGLPQPSAVEEPEAEPEEESNKPVSGAPSGRVAAQVVDRLRTNAERGTTTIPTEVIEKIITVTAREVPGLHAFPAADDEDRAIAIDLDGRTAAVRIRLVVEFGFAVHSVAEKVRTKVISALENLIGLEVTGVDILVEDIHIPDPEPEPEADPAE
jgi:uncharacterized alkaline shock family protein YloU